MARKLRRTGATFFNNTNLYFEHLTEELNKLKTKEIDKICKDALEQAIKLPAEDMAREFDVNHVRSGNTQKGFKQTKPRKDNKTGSYTISAGYFRRQGTGFVAMFFDYGNPYMDSPKSKASVGFIARAFGTDNGDRREMIESILEKRVRKGIEEMQARLAAKAKTT